MFITRYWKPIRWEEWWLGDPEGSLVPLPFALQRYVNVGGRVNPQIWKLIFKGGKKGGSRKSINEEAGGVAEIPREGVYIQWTNWMLEMPSSVWGVL